MAETSSPSEPSLRFDSERTAPNRTPGISRAPAQSSLGKTKGRHDRSGHRQGVERRARDAPDTVRVHMASFGKKIEPEPSSPQFIVTEPWVGYRFIAEPIDD